MIATASYELSKELSKYDACSDTEHVWVYSVHNPEVNKLIPKNYLQVTLDTLVGAYSYCAAPDLEYLLQKLPKHYNDQWLRIAPITDDKWAAYYIEMGVKTAGQDEWADTPCDAACQLFIELHKQGILTPGGKE